MRLPGQTTIIKRVLDRRARLAPAVQEDTSATIAVMLRVLPPPRSLLATADSVLRAQLEHRLAPELLDCEVAADDAAALHAFDTEFRPIVVTDSVQLVRTLRSQQSGRAPYLLQVTSTEDGAEREMAVLAGADDCITRTMSDCALHARIAAARRIAELEAVLRIALDENRKLSTTDDLTRVASRRFFSKHFPREVDRAARYGRALGLIVCDIDLFKNINDALGHAGGDEILKQFGARLQEGLRRGIDWVARIGGEEFAIVLPETDYEQALGVARKLRARIGDQPFAVQGKTLKVTASFGLCGSDRVPPGEPRMAQHLLKVADAALYRSKHAGRNRVTATLLGVRTE